MRVEWSFLDTCLVIFLWSQTFFSKRDSSCWCDLFDLLFINHRSIGGAIGVRFCEHRLIVNHRWTILKKMGSYRICCAVVNVSLHQQIIFIWLIIILSSNFFLLLLIYTLGHFRTSHPLPYFFVVVCLF